MTREDSTSHSEDRRLYFMKHIGEEEAKFRDRNSGLESIVENRGYIDQETSNLLAISGELDDIEGCHDMKKPKKHSEEQRLPLES